jgi:4'-phosphopantetheinyl transferase EntD
VIHHLVVNVGQASACPNGSVGPSTGGDRLKPVLHFFTPSELDTANGFQLPKRREEWLLSRYAAKKLAVELGIVEDPRSCAVERPVLYVDGQPTTWFVSLSHSSPYAGAALSHEPVGIDVQVVRDIAERATHLFLSDREADEMRGCTIAHRALHFWCAKEAAWKRRSEEFSTLKQLPVRLLEQRDDGLLFDQAETRLDGGIIVALTV